jgi:hypothetical protein
VPKGNAELDIEMLGNLFGVKIVNAEVKVSPWGRQVLSMEVEGEDISELGVALTIFEAITVDGPPAYRLSYQPLQ